MADLRPLAPTLTYGLPASVTTESRGAIGAVALDWRRALGDSVTTRTLEQRDLHPFARAHRAGERDLTRGLASGTQYVAGSGPPEPLTYCVRPVNTLIGRHVPDGHGLQLAAVHVDALEEVPAVARG
jgi:hypothetical protein